MLLFIKTVSLSLRAIIRSAAISYTNYVSFKEIASSLALLAMTGSLLIILTSHVHAANGIYRTINFQGKVVNKTSGTNVTNGNYDFTFKLYDAASGGSLLWTENWTGGNQIAVTDGIFRATLGSITTFASAGVDFNSDSLYLDITFNGETMGTRVRFTAVPYALNAEKVSGLTVTNNGGNTLNIAANKTLTVNNSITFSGTDTTAFTLPTSSDTLVGLAETQTLTNKTIGSTGLVFSNATTDITTGTNETLTLTPNGNGNVLINPAAGGQSALIVNKTGANDIFTASASGVTRFVIDNSGNVGIGVTGPTSLLHVSKSTVSSGPLAFLDATQTTVNGSDTSDMGLSISHTLTANSGSSELVQRGAMISLTNNLTGGGAVSNLRGLNLKVNTSTNTVTTSLDNIYIENGTTNGTVTDSRGLMINGLQGANRAGVVINSLTGTNNSYLVMGTGNIPVGNFGIYNSATFNNYLEGNLGIGTASPANKLIVTGAPAQGGNALVVFNQTNADDILTASASGTTKFRLANTGRLFLDSSYYNASCTALETDGSGQILCGTDDGGVGGTNYWQLNAGALSPFSLTADLNLGATATSSAKISLAGSLTRGKAVAIFNQTEDQDILTASVSGVTRMALTNEGNLVFHQAAVIQTKNDANATGDIYFSSGSVTSGNFPSGDLYIVSGDTVGNGNTGNITIDSGDSASGTEGFITIGDTNAPSIILGNPNSTVQINSGSPVLNGIPYATDTNGTIAYTGAGGSGLQCLSSLNGGTPAWSACTNYWQLNAGALSPFSLTADLNLGASATSSAKISLAGSLTRGMAAAIINQTEAQDIFTASASGTTKFTIANTGDITSLGGNLNATFGDFAINVPNGGLTLQSTNTFAIQAASISLANQATTISIKDNDANSFKIAQGGNSYLEINTQDDVEVFKLNLPAGGATSSTADLFTSAINKTINLGAGSSAVAETVNIGGNGGIDTINIGTGLATADRLITLGRTGTMNSTNNGASVSLPGGLYSSGAVTGKALAILNQNGDQDILAASSSGSKVFSVSRIPSAGSSGDVVSINPSLTNMDGSDTVRGLYINFTNGSHAGASNVLNAIDVGNITGSGNATETALNIGTGWDTGIAIASGGITISGGSFSYTGSARPTKTITFSPEYAGGILTASESATITGSMTSDASPSANFRTYYEWSASDGTNLQDYTVAIRVKLPKDFSAWAASNAIQIDYNTEQNLVADNKFDVYIYHPADSSSNPVYLKTANVGATGKVWTTLTIDDSEIDDNVSADWDQSDETAVIYLKMYSRRDFYTQIGDITLNYLAAF